MSLPKPSGLKTPSKIGKPSGLPQPKAEIPAPGSQRKAQNSTEDGTATTTSSGPEPMAAPTPSDDFIIGDRVYIGGTKPGFIAFLGETQFAPGEWAGVVLDEPAGKNDGSVAGVKYFQCEAKRGVFARISKLSRMPGAVSGKSGDSGENTGKSMPHHVPSVSPTPGSNNGGDTPARSNTPRLGLAGRKGSSGSVSSLNNNTGKSAAAVSATNLASLATTVPADSPILKIGARVLVSGSKPGTLRFLGTTDFAKGQWAGVDLDEPNGKNDGAVAGKRYFSCKPMYGLFAPVHKVARMTGNVGIHATPARNTVSTTSLPGATPWSTNRLPMSSNLRREHSTSQDSISSLSSTASSVSRSRVRLGVTSLNNISPGTAQAGKSAQRSLNVSATTSALQKALKEKEEHIEQLLKERDLERSEVARAAAQVDEAESQLAALRTEYERYRDDAEEKLGKGHELLLRKQQDADELSGKLEDEKRKVEDLQFQIEEESISKDDLEVKTEQEEVRVHKLEARLKDERERADRFQAELEKIKISTSNEEKSKTARVSELEEIVDDRTRSMRLMEARLGEIEDKCNTSESKNEKMQETINNLTEQINNKDTASSSKTNEITELKSRISELQRELEASEEKCKQFTNDKTKLEEQIGELMRNSGDSSQQLSLLNEQLRDKDRKLEETQAALSDSSLDRAKLMDKIEEISQQNNVHIETLTNKHNDELQKAHTQVQDMQAEVEKKSSKLGQLTEQYEKDLLELRTRKDCEIEDIRKTLHTRTDEVQQRDQQINDKEQQIQQISMEKQNIESEKQNLNKSLSEVKSEKETLMNELSQIKSSIEHADTEQTALQNDNKNLQEKLNLLQQEKDKALADKEEAAADRNQIDEIRSGLEFEVEELKTHLEDKDTELTEFETRLADLESANKKQTESLTEANAALQTAKVDLEQSAQSISSVQHELTSVISERDSLKVDLEKALQAEQDRFELEEEKAGLETQVQEMSSRLSELDNVKKESLTLRKSVEESRSLIAEKDQEKTLLKEVISRLESENLSLQQFKSSAQDLENENFQLEEKLLNLEQALSDAKERDILSNIDTSGDAILSKLTADKEAAQNQAEFLNSVIVDLHRKNDEIKVQLETFQSGHMVNGSSDGYLDHGSHEHRIAPRLFCDICDQFDLHDTDDCPLQAMSDSPPPSHHHGIRGEQRPYCEVCEESEGMLDRDAIGEALFDSDIEYFSDANTSHSPVEDKISCLDLDDKSHIISDAHHQTNHDDGKADTMNETNASKTISIKHTDDDDNISHEHVTTENLNIINMESASSMGISEYTNVRCDNNMHPCSATASITDTQADVVKLSGSEEYAGLFTRDNLNITQSNIDLDECSIREWPDKECEGSSQVQNLFLKSDMNMSDKSATDMEEEVTCSSIGKQTVDSHAKYEIFTGAREQTSTHESRMSNISASQTLNDNLLKRENEGSDIPDVPRKPRPVSDNVCDITEHARKKDKSNQQESGTIEGSSNVDDNAAKHDSCLLS